MPSSRSKYVTQFESRPLSIALVVSVCYFAAALITPTVFPGTLPLLALQSIAVTAVFLGGARVSLLIVILAGIVAFATSLDPITSLVLGISSGIAAAAVGYMLRALKLDLLFRQRRDALAILGGAVVAGMVELGTQLSLGHSGLELSFFYAFAVQMIGTTFLMRWIAKVGFKRTPAEWIEIIGSLSILIGIYYLYFIVGVAQLWNISLVWYSIPVLFWIALRLRPRFVTLSLVCVAGLVAFGTVRATGGLVIPLSSALLLCGLSASFLLIAAQEEERRVYRSRMQQEVAALQNLAVRAESESKAKNDFIAVLSHELRNPLAPLTSYVELLQLSGERPQEEKETLALMSERLGTIRLLLDDLLDISRIAEGKILIRRAHLDLRDVISRAISSTEHYRVELHQSVHYKRPNDPIFVSGDQVRLEQVFSNLLTNASKYSHSGHTITVSVEIADTNVDVRISDTGVGISSDMLTRIFEPFFQVEQGSRTRKGIGIGLWLARNLVELHGGDVRVESEGEQKGSTFIVELPLEARG